MNSVAAQTIATPRQDGQAGRAAPSAACRPPRVLICCQSWGEASETWIRRQAATIRRLRVSVASWKNVAPSDGTDVHHVPFDPAPYHSRGRWLLRLRNLPGGNFYGSAGAEAKHLSALLADLRPDVVLCPYATTALRILPVARRLRIPVIAHCNGYDLSGGLGNKWYRWSLRRWAGGMDAFVVVAAYMRDWLVANGVDPHRVHQIPYGVPLSDYTPASDLAGQPCRFLCVGRLVEKKAPQHVLRAFARCHARAPGVTLAMIGSGPLEGACRQLAEELGIAQAVTFAGSQPATKVAAAMSGASVFVQHSVTASGGDKEGWPVAIAEAMASGLPVVATRHAEIPNQVVHGQTGVLVSEHDWQAMSDAMAELALGPCLRQAMGAAGRRRATEFFDVVAQVGRLEDVLLATIRGREAA
jgi:glycosyltransferase involved in cell wall biosynthesis